MIAALYKSYFALILIMLAAFPTAAYSNAVKTIETRELEIYQGLQYSVCPDGSLEKAEGELAHDLRIIIRYRIASGYSNSSIIRFMENRYGNFLSIKPEFSIVPYISWLILFLFAILAITAGIFYYCRLCPTVKQKVSKEIDPIMKDNILYSDQKDDS